MHFLGDVFGRSRYASSYEVLMVLMCENHVTGVPAAVVHFICVYGIWTTNLYLGHRALIDTVQPGRLESLVGVVDGGQVVI